MDGKSVVLRVVQLVVKMEKVMVDSLVDWWVQRLVE